MSFRYVFPTSRSFITKEILGKKHFLINKERPVTPEDLDTSRKTQKYIAMLLEDIRDNLTRARRPKDF